MKNRKTVAALAALVFALFFAVGPAGATSPQISCDAPQADRAFDLRAALEPEDPPGCYEIYCSSSPECTYVCGAPAICDLESGWPGRCFEL